MSDRGLKGAWNKNEILYAKLAVPSLTECVSSAETNLRWKTMERRRKSRSIGWMSERSPLITKFSTFCQLSKANAFLKSRGVSVEWLKSGSKKENP